MSATTTFCALSMVSFLGAIGEVSLIEIGVIIP